VITGPQTTNNLGNETHLTDNRIPKTKDGFHIYDSNISDDGTTIKLNSNTEITGSLFVSGAFYISSVATISSSFSLPSGSSLILTSGSNIYVDSSGSITGSLSGSVFGIGNVVAFSSSVNSRFSGVYSSSAQLPSGLVSASSQVLNGSGVYSSSAQLPSGLVSSSAQISALGFGAGGATGSSNAPILAVATLSSSYSASLNDCVLLLSASNMIVTLPTAVGNTGKVYYVKNLLAVGTQTIKTAGGRIETIAANTGDVTATIGGSGANLIIVSNGVDWWELGTH
jgi:hypothetical protein